MSNLVTTAQLSTATCTANQTNSGKQSPARLARVQLTSKLALSSILLVSKHTGRPVGLLYTASNANDIHVWHS